ncbi:WG repeat-containing protein [Draconibacterium mangrovi]|uniref:WG repeat-containing protein n=1 Tax=Draconibacterium mangrovi TaxID=2697469 RepID=UPI0013D2DEB5|nr:WG repeat-containing protein [Draconibacterium mangrovi]
MKNILLIIAGVMIYSCSHKKELDYWIRECDSTGIKCRYIDRQGEVKIPYGRYYYCYTDTFKNIAFVSGETGIIGINRKEEKLFNVYIFDNGPDYIVDGTFRIIEQNKMGFADTLGNIIIPTIYDFTYPFEKGLALVNIGGHSESIDPSDPLCEYHTWAGGKWGIINKKGDIIKDIEYDREWQKGKDILTNDSEILELENGILKNKE